MNLLRCVNFKEKYILQANLVPELSDQLLVGFFSKNDGYFVDVGANEPVKNSQTYNLERMGWSGLLIEPLPDCCDRLRAERTSKVLEFACSTRENHGLKLTLNVAGSLSTLEDKLMATECASNKTIQVDSRTLDSLLLENNVNSCFDLLSIDVEGHENSLFDGFSINQWKPKLIVLEDHVLDLKKHRFMIKNGYRLLFRVGLNAWYVSPDNTYTWSLKARWQLFRKYYLGTLIRKFQFWRRSIVKPPSLH